MKYEVCICERKEQENISHIDKIMQSVVSKIPKT